MNSQTNIIQFHNGSKVFLMDMSYQPSDPLYTRFGGLELTGAFVDESNENQLQAIEILKTRTKMMFIINRNITIPNFRVVIPEPLFKADKDFISNSYIFKS
ncbi:hypothetical protein LCGC14_2122920, partial [marine sediment metagenome]